MKQLLNFNIIVDNSSFSFINVYDLNFKKNYDCFYEIK